MISGIVIYGPHSCVVRQKTSNKKSLVVTSSLSLSLFHKEFSMCSELYGGFYLFIIAGGGGCYHTGHHD